MDDKAKIKAVIEAGFIVSKTKKGRQISKVEVDSESYTDQRGNMVETGDYRITSGDGGVYSSDDFDKIYDHFINW